MPTRTEAYTASKGYSLDLPPIVVLVHMLVQLTESKKKWIKEECPIFNSFLEGNLEDDDFIKYIDVISNKIWVYEGNKNEAEYQVSDENGLGGSPIE